MKVNPDTTESSKLKGGYFLHSRPVQVLLRKAYRFYFARVSGRQRLFSGVYSSYEEALAAAPAGKPTIYDDSGFNYRANYRVILSSDYPILYWLSQLISSHASLADFGGNVGMAFYSYQKYLRYPDELHWVIYDLPQIIASALEVHAQEGCPRQLSFTTDIGEIDGTEIFLAAGSL